MNSNRLIWDLIKDLLFSYDCVIVPGFGGFVCNREPARIDQVSHVILPPGKRIVFNQNLKTNDGLLAGMLAQKASITYAEALHQIEILVNQLVEVLQEKKQYSIDTFGSFRLNAEANYVFLSDKQNNYLHASFGLEPIQAEFVSSGYARIKRTRIFRENKVTKNSGKRRVKNLGPKLLVTALALMFLVNGWIYFNNPSSNFNLNTASLHITSWFDSVFNKPENQPAVIVTVPETTVTAPIITDTTTIEIPTVSPVFIPELNIAAIYDSINAETQIEETIVEPTPIVEEEKIETPAYEFSLAAFGKTLAACKTNLYIPHLPIEEVAPIIPETPAVVEETPIITTPVPHIETPIVGVNRYFIIGGVFCKGKNAEHFKTQLIQKGYQAEIVINPDINCQRVSYASFAKRMDAELKLKEIQSSENPDAWILAGK